MANLSVLLNTGQEVLIDPEDIWVLGHLWYAKNSRGKVYAYNNELGFLHRVIAKTPPGMVTDHDNGDTFDARRGNLKPVTHLVNSRNRKGAQVGSTSGILGVYPRASGRWTAGIRLETGKQLWLGTFETPGEAEEARLQAEREHWGRNYRG